MNDFADLFPDPFEEFGIDSEESETSSDSEIVDINGRIYVYGPGDDYWALSTNQSHFLKDVLMRGDRVGILQDENYEFFVIDDLSSFTLDQTASPNTIVFIGQKIIIRNRNAKWYWKFKVINSRGFRYYQSENIYERVPVTEALVYVESGADWVEIVKSRTPTIHSTYIYHHHWWRDATEKEKATPPFKISAIGTWRALLADDDSSSP